MSLEYCNKFKQEILTEADCYDCTFYESIKCDCKFCKETGQENTRCKFIQLEG